MSQNNANSSNNVGKNIPDKEMLCKPEDICQNVNKALEEFRGRQFDFISNKSIAKKIGISEDGFSRRLSDRTPFAAHELKNLADYLGVSCDTLTAIPAQGSHADIAKDAAVKLLLEEDSLQYITDMQSSFPEGFQMLNMILENDAQICERLLRILLYYSYAIIFKVTALSESQTVINPDSTKRMIKSLALSDLSFLLDDVSKLWNSSERYEKNAELEKQMRKNRVPEKERRRMRAKSNMIRGQINTIEFINIVEQLSSQKSSYLNPWGYDDKYDFEEYKEEDDNTVVQIIQKNEQILVHADISPKKTEDTSTTTV
ncbi:MAG: hypothetical protein J6M64_04855 [Oscillospiraceae bacterium]|nr:hypothetical protein [Oscillospiraceae bacterium]